MNQNIGKGLLILIVIIDHNEFSRSLFPGFLLGMSFHVAGFMFMPFLRPPLTLAGSRGRNYLFRLYYPFLWLVLAMALLVTLLSGAPLATRLHTTAVALYSGNFRILKDATQMGMLWYLPSFIALMLLRAAIEAGGKAWKTIALVLVTAVHGLLGPLATAWQDALPLGLLPALYLAPLAYATVWLQQRVLAPRTRGTALAMALLPFVAIKALQIHWQLDNEVGSMLVASYADPAALLVNDLEAVCGTLVLFQLARWPLGSWLEACGQYSLQIYLFHAFVALALYQLVRHLLPTANPAPAFLLTVALTAALTLLGARRLMASPLARLLFPRTPAELAGRGGGLATPADQP